MTTIKTSHTTDANKTANRIVIHSTDYLTKTTTARTHTTDSYLMLDKVLSSRAGAKLSENPSVIMNIGNGLSTRIGFFTVATWNSAGRPPKPKRGTIGFNFQTHSLEIWSGDSWFTTSSLAS